MQKRKSIYRGVTYDAKADKWMDQITIGGKKFNLGRYEDEAEAAKVYLEAKVTKEVHAKSILRERFLDPDCCNVACLDIEASGLRGDFGVVICAVMKPYGSEPDKAVGYVIDLEPLALLESEAKLLEDINKAVQSYDGVIGYYSSKYDLPMLRTRMIYHGIDPFPKMPSLDVYFTAKGYINTSTRRLERIGDLVRASCQPDLPGKTKMDVWEWAKVLNNRDQTALDYIVEHCFADVGLLEGVTRELYQYLPERITRR